MPGIEEKNLRGMLRRIVAELITIVIVCGVVFFISGFCPALGSGRTS